MRRALVFALGLGATSCGLLSGESATPPFPADGIDDFGEASPIEVCVAGTRVVAPAAATGAGSICVAVDREAKRCGGDGDCDGLERCLCGACIVESCVGSSCGDARVCRGNRCTAACTRDGECAADEKCALGGCARACSSDGACHFGEHCDPLGGVCTSSLCSGIACGAGETCRTQETIADLHEPELATIGGAPAAFVRIDGGAGSLDGIFRLEVKDDLLWTTRDAKPFVSVADAAAAAILARDRHVETYFALADGSGIYRAVSEDGGFGAPDRTPALSPSEDWEQGFVGSPAVVSFGGTTVLAYEGGPGAGIGLATIDEHGAAERVQRKPILTPSSISDPVFWRDVTEVRAPYLAVADSTLRIYFTGRGIEAGDAIVDGKRIPAPPNDSIGMVATRDLVHFDAYPAGPVYSRVVNLRAFLGESEPVVQIRPGGAPGAAIVFLSADASGKHPTGLARASR